MYIQHVQQENLGKDTIYRKILYTWIKPLWSWATCCCSTLLVIQWASTYMRNLAICNPTVKAVLFLPACLNAPITISPSSYGNKIQHGSCITNHNWETTLIYIATCYLARMRKWQLSQHMFTTSAYQEYIKIHRNNLFKCTNVAMGLISMHLLIFHEIHTSFNWTELVNAQRYQW